MILLYNTIIDIFWYIYLKVLVNFIFVVIVSVQFCVILVRNGMSMAGGVYIER
jgi:hypothetical protein